MSRLTFHEGKLNAHFNDNRISEEGSHCIRLSVILTDSAFKIGKTIIYFIISM